MKTRIASLLQKARNSAPPAFVTPSATEPHYTPQEIAALWKMHTSSVRRMFAGERGVIVTAGRKHQTIRIPHSVLERVHRERMA